MSAFGAKRTWLLRCKCPLMTQSGHRRPVGLWLLTGPFQMIGLEIDPEILAMFGYAGRDYECSEEPTPRLNKFGQDP
jgi:hypothetical protein